MRLTIGQILATREPFCNGNVRRAAEARPNHGTSRPKRLETVPILRSVASAHQHLRNGEQGLAAYSLP